MTSTITIARITHAAAVAACALLAPASAAWAQQPPPALHLSAGITQGPQTDGITEYDVANGLKVLLLADDSADTVTTNVTYLVGSRQEGYGESGMAHLLEHMLFKGTPTHLDIKGEMTRHGARFNGSTSYDRTNYFQTFPATADNLDWALQLEADRMVNSRVSATDLQSEMTVVRNEYESGENNPFRILLERMASSAYVWHAYGRAVIGARSDIENVPIPRLQGFYHNYYQPDNAILIIAGRFDPQHALDDVARFFGVIPRPARTLQATYTVEPDQDGERSVTLRRVGDVQVVAAMYHIPPGTSSDYAPVEMLTQVLAAQPTGRLYQALVEPGKAANVFGSERQQREAGTAYFGASVSKDGSLQAARDALEKVLDGFAEHPVTDEEVERARASLMSEFDKLTSDTRGLAVTLSEFAALGDWRYLFLYRDRMQHVKREDVQRVALHYLKPQNRTIGLFIPTDHPDRAEIPPLPDIAAVMKDYHGDNGVAAGEAFDPSPANIDRRTTIETLPNGIKLALLPKKTRGARVIAQISLHWGDESTLENRGAACGAAGAMLVRGTLKHTRAQINDMLDQLHARANASLDGATADTTRPNLAGTLRLVAEMLREPSFPADEFEQMRRSTLEDIASEKSDPGSLADTALARHLNPYPQSHALYTPSIEENEARWRGVSLADARRCYQDLLGATGADIAIVGDFDPVEIKALVQELFAEWKSPSPYVRIPTKYFDVTGEKRVIETPDKANAVYRAALNIKLRDDDPDYPALYLANYILGGSSGSRLWARVREKEGLSYDVRSSLSVGPLDHAGEFAVSAIYAPQNRARVEQAVSEELDRALKSGFTREEVASAKRGLLETRRLSRTQDGAVAGRWAHDLYLGRTFQWEDDLDAKISALTPVQLLAALRKYVQPDAMSVVRAGDFAGAQARAAAAPSAGAAAAATAGASEAK
jgi:zinc protease